VDRAGVRRGVLFRIAVATDIVVNVRQRAARPELIPQVNVQVFAAGLRWTGAGTLDGQRGFRYAGSRGTSTHRAARRGHLCKSIIHRHRKCFDKDVADDPRSLPSSASRSQDAERGAGLEDRTLEESGPARLFPVKRSTR